LCLVCHELVAVSKEFTIKRHYETKHNGYGQHLPESEQSMNITGLRNCLQKQQAMLNRTCFSQELMTHAGLMVTHKLAKNNKPFSDGEFMKENMETTVKPFAQKWKLN